MMSSSMSSSSAPSHHHHSVAPSSSTTSAAAAAAALAVAAVEPASLLFTTQLASALSTMGDAQYWEENISATTIRQYFTESDPSNLVHNATHLLKAMKWLLASMSKGRDVSDFYPHVVKCVGTTHPEVRKMVYMYLVQYASHNATTTELSLLSINAFQRGLADAEPLVRAWALRVLTSLAIPDVRQIQILAVQSCARDTSPYVRKCAAVAVAKLLPRGDGRGRGATRQRGGDALQRQMLLDVMQQLLDHDQSTMVLTSVLVAFAEMCSSRSQQSPHQHAPHSPQRPGHRRTRTGTSSSSESSSESDDDNQDDINGDHDDDEPLHRLHGSFRKICHFLTDMDEWGQVVVLELLARYCRRFFAAPPVTAGSAERIDQLRRVLRRVPPEQQSPHAPSRGPDVAVIPWRTSPADPTTTTPRGPGAFTPAPDSVVRTGAVLGFRDDPTLTTAVRGPHGNGPASSSTGGFRDHVESGGQNVPPTNPAWDAATRGVPLPPRTSSVGTIRKVKRRVVKKGFYSDEEDESTEEEVYADTLTGTPLAGSASSALREQSVLSSNQRSPMGSTTTTNALDASGPKPLLYAAAGNLSHQIDEDEDLAEDHRLLLHSAMPLLKSRNSAVVLAVCALQYYCGVASIRVRAAMGKALVRIHRTRASREIQYAVLTSIASLVRECPSAFTPFLVDFYVSAMDPPFTRLIKLDILTSLALEPVAITAVLKELRTYVTSWDTDPPFLVAVIAAVGRVVEMARIVYDRHGIKSNDVAGARRDANEVALNSLHGLVALTQQTSSHASTMVVGEAVRAIQRIYQLLISDHVRLPVKDPRGVQQGALRRVLLLLLRSLTFRKLQFDGDTNLSRKSDAELDDDDEDDDDRTNPAEKRFESLSRPLPGPAAAATLWMMGEALATLPAIVSAGSAIDSSVFYSDATQRCRIRHELIRLLVSTFAFLESSEKEQAIHFASKLMISKAVGIQTSADESPLCELLLSMGRVDLLPDVRDRARYESIVIRNAIGLSYDTDAMDLAPSTLEKLSLADVRRMTLSLKPPSSALPLEIHSNTKNDGTSGSLFRFGTLSSMVGHRARSSYIALPPWATENSPDSLRTPAKKVEATSYPSTGQVAAHTSSAKGSEPKTNGFYNNESSSSDNETDSGSSSDGETSSSSSSDDTPDARLSRGQQPAPIPAQIATSTLLKPNNIPRPTTEESSCHSSSSSSSSSSSDDDVDYSVPNTYSSNHAGTVTGTGNLLGHGSSNGDAFRSASTSMVDDFQGLVVAPVRKSREELLDVEGDLDRESSHFWTLVRAEHAGGLSVQGRYLYGASRYRQAQQLGLNPDQATVVCVQLVLANRNKATGGSSSTGAFRRLRLARRGGHPAAASVISPRQVEFPPELETLSPDQEHRWAFGIDFQRPSDRDGTMVAKLELHFAGGIGSGSGSLPLEIKPQLADTLLPMKGSTMLSSQLTAADFDRAVSQLQGFSRVETTFAWRMGAHATTTRDLSRQLRRWAALTPIYHDDDAETVVRLAGRLPVAGDPVYVRVQRLVRGGNNNNGSPEAADQGKLLVCCDHALPVNSIMNVMKKATDDWQKRGNDA